MACAAIHRAVWLWAVVTLRKESPYWFSCVIQELVRVFSAANELTAGKEDDGLALMTHVSMCGDNTDILFDSF